MQLSIEAGTIKRPIPYENYVDESFAQQREAGRDRALRCVAARASRALALAPAARVSRRRDARRTRAELKAGVFDPPRAAPDFSLRGSDGARAEAQPLPRQGGRRWRSASPRAPTSVRRRSRRWPRRSKKLGAAARRTAGRLRDGRSRARRRRAPAEIPRGVRPDVHRRHRNARAARPRCARSTASPPTSTSIGVRATRSRHSSFIYLIDREGKLRALMPYRAARRTTTCTTSRSCSSRERPCRARGRAARSEPLGRALLASGVLAITAWAALAPIHSASRDADLRDSEGHLGAPDGRRQGRDPAHRDPAHARPARTCSCSRTTTTCRSSSGPTLMMPGQSFRLPFAVASSYSSPARRTRAAR